MITTWAAAPAALTCCRPQPYGATCQSPPTPRHRLRMDELHSLHPNGLFLRREAMQFGYRDRDLADARRAGVITRIRHGAYVPTEEWKTRDEIGRYRLRGQAVCLTHEGRVALSHTSGAAEHGLRLWQPDLENVHVVRLDKTSGRHHAGVVYHEDTWHPDDIYAKDELLRARARNISARRRFTDGRRTRIGDPRLDPRSRPGRRGVPVGDVLPPVALAALAEVAGHDSLGTARELSRSVRAWPAT